MAPTGSADDMYFDTSTSHGIEPFLGDNGIQAVSSGKHAGFCVLRKNGEILVLGRGLAYDGWNMLTANYNTFISHHNVYYGHSGTFGHGFNSTDGLKWVIGNQ